MEKECRTLLRKLKSKWHVVNDCVLESCCGEHVEWDCESCPECGAANPLVKYGYI